MVWDWWSRVVGLLARAIVALMFTQREIGGAERIPHGRPVLVVANHFNGVVDPLQVVAALGRLPRFLAKATLWKPRLLRPILALVGMIPVARARDDSSAGGRAAANTSAFRAAHEALAANAVVAIFPEGTTHDLPQLSPLHTGAARIALGAAANGVEDLVVLPIGIVYDDKVAFRSRVLVRVGEPIDLSEHPDLVTPAGEGDRAAVSALTDLVLARLRAVCPDYADDRQQAACRMAATVAARRPGERVVAMSRTEPIAERLSYAPESAQVRLRQALSAYVLDLSVARLDDVQVLSFQSLTRMVATLAWRSLLLFVLGPVMLTGVLVNAAPYAVSRLVSDLVRVPVTKGTVRVLVSLIAFPAAWAVAAATADHFFRGWWAVAFVFYPVAGLVAAWWLGQLWAVVTEAHSWAHVKARLHYLPGLAETRQRLVSAVDAAIAEPPLPPRPLVNVGTA